MAKTASVWFIFITLLLDSLGIGLLIPVFPDIIRRFSSDPVFVAKYFGYFIAVYALMQFVASPVLGSLSDRFGRRPVLLLSLFGAGIDYLFMAYAPNLWLLFTGRVISGLSGASFTVATAYMADISDDSNRSANFGMIGAAFGVGFVFGPALGGLLAHYGPHACFLAAAGLNLLNFFFGLVALPESLPKTQRRQVGLRKLNPFASILKILRPSSSLAFIWVYILIFFAGQVHPANWTLYTQTKFGWSALEVGLSLTFVGVMIAVGQGGLTRVLIPRLGEPRAVFFGTLVYTIEYAAIAFATSGWMLYAFMLIFVLSGIATPALQSLISRETPPSEQGELQGTLTSLGSLTAVLAPVLFSELFARCTSPGGIYFPGVAYVTAALLCAVAAAVLLAAKGWTFFAPRAPASPGAAAPSVAVSE